MLVAFYVAVYKSTVEVAKAESEMQTVAVESDQMTTQTDSSEWMQSSNTQTNSSEWSEVIGTQTDHSQWLQCEATQTDTGDKPRVVSTQTDWKEWLESTDVQTDCSHWQSTVTTQTDVKQLSSTAAQTKEMRIEQTFADIAVETHANLATQVIIYFTFSVGCQCHNVCFCNLLLRFSFKFIMCRTFVITIFSIL